MYKSTFETNWRKLNKDLVLEEIKELLLIFLGVIMILTGFFFFLVLNS